MPRVAIRHRAAIVAILGCAGAAAASAAAPSAPLPDLRAHALWATIDACNPRARPGTLGIRGSMPGTGDPRERMFMQFRVEYLRARVWTNIARGGHSAFIAIGGAGAAARQAGVDVTIAPHPGRHYLLRGVVTFEWRLHGRVLARTLRSSTAGHDAGAGADPPGYSASVCSITAKRRGSFVMTPVTPSAASAAIRRRSLTVHT